jgi:hypothetical protein
MALVSPDQWAADTGRNKPPVAAWADSVPDEVRDLLRGTRQSMPALVDWFHAVVAEHYPDAAWPREATRHRVSRLLKEIEP